jgi:hypothetical protein
MSLFRKKREINLVKRSKLKKDGWETTYCTEMDGKYVSNSIFFDRLSAEEFFDRLCKLKGEHETIEIVKSRRV